MNNNINAYDDEEQRLMNVVETGMTQPISESEKQVVLSALQNEKSKAISIEINENDLHGIKQKADKVGMPYQTLINTILHRYVSGDIILKEQI